MARAGAAPWQAVFACTQHWASPYQVGTHHIARCFAERGWRVAFVGAPVSPLHLAGLGEDAAARVAAWRAGPARDAASGVWHLVPFAPLPWGAAPVLRGRAWVRAAWAACRPRLAAQLRAAGFDRPDLACTDHFLHEGLLLACQPRRTVYRRADHMAALPGAGADFAARDAAFARRADLVVCPTPEGAATLARAGVLAPMVLPNGVRLERFMQPAAPPPEYQGDDRPVVVYVGETGPRVDLELLAAGARALPGCRWMAIGPVAPAAAQALAAAGVTVLGPRPHDRLAGYLQHARVGVVPFSLTQHAALIREVNPLKVLEYAACGLPVVGTAGCRYPEGLPTPLAVCTSAAQFIDAVRHHAAQPRPPRPSAAQLAPFGWAARLQPLFAWLEDAAAEAR